MPNLRPGGSERVVVNLANEFKSRSYEVSILLISGHDMTLSNLLRQDINVIDLKLKRFRNILLKPLALFRIFKKNNPQIVISAFGEINPLIIPFKVLFRKTKFIARESSIPSLRIENVLIKKFYRFLYNYYDIIVVQSRSMEIDLISNFSINPKKTILINNPINPFFIESKLLESDEHIIGLGDFLLFVGTIDSNKRLDRIITFYNKLRYSNYFYKLVILGNGPELENIKFLVNNSKYNFDIIIYPYSDNPFKFMKLAKFLIIASNYEGFPNVGIEANYCGLPIILSNETKGGAIELIDENFNGIIFDFDNPDFSKLEQKFNRDKIKEHARDVYNVSSVAESYIELF